MNYNYPRAQDIYKGTVFLMAETVDSNKYDEYHIPYRNDNAIQIKNIKHENLIQYIERGVVMKLEKNGSFNNKQFYRIPIRIQEQLF